ncbi:MAG: helix-turn-helix transcriptional regulator [Gammaproteobacteria bacterium]
MSDDRQEQWSARVAAALFGVIALFIVSDLIVDYHAGASWRHLAVELVVLLVAGGGIAFLWRQFEQARSDLAEARIEAERWRKENHELIQGLGFAIARQFTSWQLTKAEAEVALLILKGLSHKEIAEIRQTSERTIREQARAVYRKAGLSGRSSLSAFFLEDLLLPQSQAVEE